jgi:outer membrane phospholipase A
LHPNLIEALEQARQYGRVAITSICHGRHAARSYHYKTRDGVSLAVDFRVRGNYRAVARHFKGYPGGFAHYGGGSQ